MALYKNAVQATKWLSSTSPLLQAFVVCFEFLCKGMSYCVKQSVIHNYCSTMKLLARSTNWILMSGGPISVGFRAEEVRRSMLNSCPRRIAAVKLDSCQRSVGKLTNCKSVVKGFILGGLNPALDERIRTRRLQPNRLRLDAASLEHPVKPTENLPLQFFVTIEQEHCAVVASSINERTCVWRWQIAT